MERIPVNCFGMLNYAEDTHIYYGVHSMGGWYRAVYLRKSKPCQYVIYLDHLSDLVRMLAESDDVKSLLDISIPSTAEIDAVYRYHRLVVA